MKTISNSKRVLLTVRIQILTLLRSIELPYLVSPFLVLFAFVLQGCLFSGKSPQLEGLTPVESPLPVSVKKVVLLVLENADMEEVLQQPAFLKFSRQGALLSKYFAVTHPSQPNYIALISGSTQGVTDNHLVELDRRHIGDLLEARKKTWKAYAENYPGNCFTDEKSETYVRKHVPFLSFQGVLGNPARCQQVVEASQFARDLKNNDLPDFSIYIPNQNNNGHDTGVAFANHWFSESFLPLIESMDKESGAKKSGVLFIVTFDEGSYAKNNQIFTVFYGEGVRPGVISGKNYNHYNLLATVEKILDIGNLGQNDAGANPINDIWAPSLVDS